MEKTRESLTRAMTWPALLVIGQMAYLFAPLVIEGQRAPEYWLRVGAVQVAPAMTDASLTSPCARPEAFLGAGDWEIMAGRLGTALIECGAEKAALVGYVDGVRLRSANRR